MRQAQMRQVQRHVQNAELSIRIQYSTVQAVLPHMHAGCTQYKLAVCTMG